MVAPVGYRYQINCMLLLLLLLLLFLDAAAQTNYNKGQTAIFELEFRN